jgi:hypothetical protein
MILIFVHGTVLIEGRVDDIAVVKQGGLRKALMMHQPKEVFTSRYCCIDPDGGRELINRSLLHVPLVKGVKTVDRLPCDRIR